MNTKQILRNIIFVGLFLVPFIPFLVSTELFFPFITTKAFTWRIIVEVVFAAWLMLAFLDTNYRPKRSLILYSILGFLLVIGLADLFGSAPLKSFWSNFERMEGYITLLHLGMFFLVISSVFKDDPAGGWASWTRWWNTSLVASFLMVIYSSLQLLGLLTINQGGVRVDGTLGNAIYLAVYMLFHIFIAMLFMWRNWQSVILRWTYGILIVLQATILYHTATRGAILGFLGGILVMAVFSVRNKEDKFVRRAGVAVLVGLVVLVSGFLAIKDSEFVKNSLVLGRFSSLTTEEIKTQGRYFIWPMAIEGAKENPLLGWGQENFNYVFQKYYSPEMYKLEPWFDRAHNIFLDWLISGGILGLLSYLSLYVALLWLIWKPFKDVDEERGDKSAGFSYTEKSILTGLIAAYFFHNLFVFDNLISYILFFSVLAYIHSRSQGKILLSAHGQVSGNSRPTTSHPALAKMALPVLGILLILSLYFVNIKPIGTNISLINALQSTQTPGQSVLAIESFKKAYDTSRLGRPEVVEHVTSNAISILTSDISVEEKNAYFNFAKDIALKQSEEANGDSRYELLTGSFLSAVGLLDESLVSLERARELIPGKQQVYFEIGSVYINKDEPLKALEFFKTAYESAPDYTGAKIIYLIGSIYAKDQVVENQMLESLRESEVAFDDRIIGAYYTNGRIEKVRGLLEDRIRLDPANAETYKKDLETLAN